MGSERLVHFDFFDMKGRIELLLSGLRYRNISYTPIDSVNYLHPGKTAEIRVDGQVVGVFGELHPLTKEKYEFGDAPVVVAEFELDLLRSITQPMALCRCRMCRLCWRISQ